MERRARSILSENAIRRHKSSVREGRHAHRTAAARRRAADSMVPLDAFAVAPTHRRGATFDHGTGAARRACARWWRGGAPARVRGGDRSAAVPRTNSEAMREARHSSLTPRRARGARIVTAHTRDDRSRFDHALR